MRDLDAGTVLDELPDHALEIAGSLQLVEPAEAAEDALPNAPALAEVLDDLQVLVALPIRLYALDSDKHSTTECTRISDGGSITITIDLHYIFSIELGSLREKTRAWICLPGRNCGLRVKLGSENLVRPPNE